LCRKPQIPSGFGLKIFAGIPEDETLKRKNLMSEKPPAFTVTDRRKFTEEGDLRNDAPATTPEESPTKPETSGPRLVTMPAPKEEPAPPPAAEPSHEPEDTEAIPEPTAEESSQAQAAYRQSSEQLDIFLRASNPGIGPTAPVTIEHVIQSIYVSAIVAMGAATEHGQKPRIDILGARQSIDMLAALEEKTKGNLSNKEQRLLQNALFEVRMMFLEITNAIAQQAQNPLPPPPGKK
jgi:hypothetical protein